MIELLGYIALVGLVCWAGSGMFSIAIVMAAFVDFMKSDDPF
jgi:hypothetical protein